VVHCADGRWGRYLVNAAPRRGPPLDLDSLTAR
jgi:hypothetical protein